MDSREKMNLNKLIEKWEQRKEILQGSIVAVTVLNDCISDLKLAISGELKPGNRLDNICHFKKHKGKLWKQVIDEDPNYVDWCLENIAGFILDETARAYLVEKQNPDNNL